MGTITLWFQLEDMFQLIVTPQGIEKVTIQLIDTPTKVYAIGARLFLSKVPLEVLQNWVLIQLIVTPHILGKVQGQIKEVCRLIEPCLLIGTREYTPRYTHSGGASGRSRGEALSGSVPLAGTSPKKPEGGVLDCGVDSEIGGGPLLSAT